MNYLNVCGNVANVQTFAPKKQGEEPMILFQIADRYYCRKDKKSKVQWIRAKLISRRVPKLQAHLVQGTYVVCRGVLRENFYTDSRGRDIRDFCLWVEDLELRNTTQRFDNTGEREHDPSTTTLSSKSRSRPAR